MKVLRTVANRARRVRRRVRNTGAEVIGTVKSNSRRNGPEEKEIDRNIKEIEASHRFKSFVDTRSGNTVKWHIDGHDYMYAVSELLDSAKESIYIMDWWLTPELYLRRPPAHHPEWRLDRLLQRKAEQGVKIYVIVYKEVNTVMTMNSQHTQNALEALHKNILCMRHPDHFVGTKTVAFWSHHEKLVVVDNTRACVGGLDLCFGRWDTHNHPLADVHPTDLSRTLFPGQDYNNARVQDFKDVDDYVSNPISIMQTPRMPWHDVHMTLCGPVCSDLSRHFVERWNIVKKRTRDDNKIYELLKLPHAQREEEKEKESSSETAVRKTRRRRWYNLCCCFPVKRSSTSRIADLPYTPDIIAPSPSSPSHGTCNVQVVRSVSDWSHGVPTEHSIQNAYIEMIEKAEHFIYIENQFFISNTSTVGPVKNQIAAALVKRIIRAAENGEKFKVIVVIPELPGFSGNVANYTSLKTIMAAQYRTIHRGGHSIYEKIRRANYDPMDFIRFYHLRAYDRINAPQSLISQMETNSGVTFHNAQVALARQWEGHHTTDKDPKVMFVKIPVSSNESSKPKLESVPLPASQADAVNICRQFQSGLVPTKSNEKVSDSVAQHRLKVAKTTLTDEAWSGSEAEEVDAYVSELLYIHSKVMIVDDKRVIMGSANLNDRSQKGDCDSEIALVVEDGDMVASTMNGKPYMASRFATTLRRKLFREHLGLIKPQNVSNDKEEVTSFMLCAPVPNKNEIGTPEDIDVADPLSDSFLKLWEGTAKTNREIFADVFRPVPTNDVRTWPALKEYTKNITPGHVRPGMGLQQIKESLSQVRGSLVECPLDFLIDEKEFVEGMDWKVLTNSILAIYI